MSKIRSRPFPFSTVMVAVTAVLTVIAVAGASLLSAERPRSYSIVDTATVSVRSTTLGVADSDLYFATQAQIDAALTKVAALGVKNVRVLIPWYDVNPDPGVFDWTRIDRVVASATTRKMGIVAVVTHSPDWAVAPGDTPVISPPAKVGDYGDFTAIVAKRYKGKISAYEIWNEPNGGTSFYPTPDPARYTQLLKAAYVKIKAVSSAVTVIAGVLGAVPTSTTDKTINAPTFLTAMYNAGAKGYFNAISFHPYQLSTPYSQGLSLAGSPYNEDTAMHNTMLSKGDGGKRIWATEYGLPTSVVTEAHQAAYIKDFMDAWGRRSWHGPMFLYTTQDATSGYDAGLQFGLYRADGTAKPAVQTVKDYTATHR
ncbi:cellulase family glycosylhydrolase [Williamsia sp.]|uniref:cellulase family glycosylhydrolase n=1 Tax=Williamsia sp. TaxID=1872085 RepID=UPI001A29925D|nr:cellulase family glycosylhydrolase [Williamsia sp.]MBJ7287769.1 cellulase family glycosylhydrolase [Williamsia sp.]